MTYISPFVAEQIVEAIITDIKDRRGLKQEWRQIDSDVQQEIREAWIRIILDWGS